MHCPEIRDASISVSGQIFSPFQQALFANLTDRDRRVCTSFTKRTLIFFFLSLSLPLSIHPSSDLFGTRVCITPQRIQNGPDQRREARGRSFNSVEINSVKSHPQLGLSCYQAGIRRSLPSSIASSIFSRTSFRGENEIFTFFRAGSKLFRPDVSIISKSSLYHQYFQ